MPSPTDPAHPDLDTDLVLLALGEASSAATVDHLATCPDCQRNLAGYRTTVELAREAAAHRHDADRIPSPDLWDGIARQLRDDDQHNNDHYDELAARRSTHPTRMNSRRQHRLALASAAAAVLVLTSGASYLIGRSAASSDYSTASTATLTAQPGTSTDITGAATIRPAANGHQLTLTTKGLPQRAGYYEVWLFDPTANNMVPIGSLGTNGQGTYTLPATVDLTRYHIVDVSAQNYDGGSVITHATSVLRGPITTR